MSQTSGALMVLEATGCLSQTDRETRVQASLLFLISSLPNQKPGAMQLGWDSENPFVLWQCTNHHLSVGVLCPSSLW